MTPTLVISALDALRVSALADAEHHIAAFTTLGPACDKCKRLLTAEQWSAPCVPTEIPS